VPRVATRPALLAGTAPAAGTARARRTLGPWLAPLAALALLGSTALAACEAAGPDREAWAPDADARGHSAPTRATAEANAAAAERLPLEDPRDFEAARRGLVARDEEVVVEGPEGRTVWDLRDYDFVEGEAPESVHPSLWRQARLNGIHGLFEVVPGIHQVRGYDLANMTLIEGESGWIVVDPLTAEETARAALDLARRHLGARPVSAVIYTHSHVDHFGGIAGVLPDAATGEDGNAPAAESREAAAKGGDSGDASAQTNVRIIAPADFLHEATSENVLAGGPMTRRAAFMFGLPLARGSRGHVDTGLGMEPAWGTVSLVPPTDLVERTPQEMVIDGVRFVFQHVPGSEAPAELTFYLPEHKAFCGAEIVSRTMHNLYTLRGAKVRDALRWSDYIDEAMRLFPEAEVVFASHHWPTWGRENVRTYLAGQRDTYKYIHDQTLRLAASGATPAEIAEQLTLPPSLAGSFANRGYYGTVRHNARAVYQFYFGWYDGNPAHLDPLPPADAAGRYVEAMGGPEAVRRRARAAFDAGEYRWAATLLDHLVFAAPDDSEARELLARTYDQLAYRAESGPWRDVYLTGAHELRHGVAADAPRTEDALGLVRRIPAARLFDALATRLVGPEAEGEDTRIRFTFTDLGESYLLWLENAVLHHGPVEGDPEVDATVRLSHDLFLRLATRQAGLRELVFSDELDVDGSRLALLSFFSLLETPDERFAIVTP